MPTKGTDSSSPDPAAAPIKRGHGGERRVHQAVSETGEIGNGIAAVGDDHAVEIDELHHPRRHAAATARRGQRGGATGSGGKQHGLVAARPDQGSCQTLDGGIGGGRPLPQARRRQADAGNIVGGGLEQAGAVGDGVEEARGRHPACRPGILGYHTGELRAFLGGGAGKRRIQHARITLGQAPALKQRIEIGQGPAVGRRSGHVMGGEIGRDGADLREQPGQRVAMPLGGDAARAFGREPGEADRAAQIARHAASGAVVMQDPRPAAPDPGTVPGLL